MLKNDTKGGGVQANDCKIIKSTVIDSYLYNTTDSRIYFSGTAPTFDGNETISMFYTTPTATIKCTSSSTSFSFTTEVFGEKSQKNIYVCGSNGEQTLSKVNYLCISTSGSESCGHFAGCYSCFMNQFPNLECFFFGQRFTCFNENLDNYVFPQNISGFYHLKDCCLQGNVDTMCGFDNVETFHLGRTKFTGCFNNFLTSSNLSTLAVCCTPASLTGDFIPYITGGSGIDTFSVLSPVGITFDGEKLGADFCCIRNCFSTSTTQSTFCGNISGWTFNTGLTYFNTYGRFHGDISNWDFSNTQVCTWQLYTYNGSNPPHFSGDISGWQLPTTLQTFYLYYGMGITCVPSNYSALTNLLNFYYYYLPAVSGDVATWTFPPNLNSVQFYNTGLCGDIANIDFPEVSSVYWRNSCFSGDVGQANIWSGSTSVYFDCNCGIYGNISEFPTSRCLQTLSLAYNPDVYWDLNTPYNTCNINGMYMYYIGGVSGSFANLTVGANLRTMNFQYAYTGTTALLCDLDWNGICDFNMRDNKLCQDITSVLTGTTSLRIFCIDANPNLSGDTTNWQVNDIACMNLSNTALSGSLSHACPVCFQAYTTNICSCFNTDFDLSVRTCTFNMANTCIQGHLSATTFNFNCFCYFSICCNSGIVGSNEFVDYVWINRRNFTRTLIYIYINSIGDVVTGTSCTLGDLGTYTGDASGWDLTETQINNLVAGTDYDGLGSNTPWDSLNKIYYMTNACCSSVSTVKRYCCFATFAYSI